MTSKIKIDDFVELNELGVGSPYINYTWRVTGLNNKSWFNVIDVVSNMTNDYPESFLRKISIKQKRIKLLLYSNYYK